MQSTWLLPLPKLAEASCLMHKLSYPCWHLFAPTCWRQSRVSGRCWCNPAGGVVCWGLACGMLGTRYSPLHVAEGPLGKVTCSAALVAALHLPTGPQFLTPLSRPIIPSMAAPCRAAAAAAGGNSQGVSGGHGRGGPVSFPWFAVPAHARESRVQQICAARMPCISTHTL